MHAPLNRRDGEPFISRAPWQTGSIVSGMNRASQRRPARRGQEQLSRSTDIYFSVSCFDGQLQGGARCGSGDDFPTLGDVEDAEMTRAPEHRVFRSNIEGISRDGYVAEIPGGALCMRANQAGSIPLPAGKLDDDAGHTLALGLKRELDGGPRFGQGALLCDLQLGFLRRGRTRNSAQHWQRYQTQYQLPPFQLDLSLQMQPARSSLR